ncbi:MAG: hypothetical protein IKJ43_03360 [Bacilli bacterium]|nr:hypothetical protein [Bacilli bacterium]
MATRMERYRDNSVKSSRSSRNKNLYNTMYNFEKYSNIEGVLLWILKTKSIYLR